MSVHRFPFQKLLTFTVSCSFLGMRAVSSIRLELTFQTWILQVWNDKTWMGHIRKSKWNIQEHQQDSCTVSSQWLELWHLRYVLLTYCTSLGGPGGGGFAGKHVSGKCSPTLHATTVLQHCLKHVSGCLWYRPIFLNKKGGQTRQPPHFASSTHLQK